MENHIGEDEEGNDQTDIELYPAGEAGNGAPVFFRTSAQEGSSHMKSARSVKKVRALCKNNFIRAGQMERTGKVTGKR